MSVLSVNFISKFILRIAVVITVFGKIVLELNILKSYTLENFVYLSSSLLLLKMLSNLPAFVSNAKCRLKLGKTFREKILSLVPKKVIAVFTLEKAYQRGFLCWLLRKRRSDRSKGRIFSHHSKTTYFKFFKVILLGMIIEIPMSAIIIWMLSDKFQSNLVLNFATVISGCYGIVWLIADRHLLQSSYHTISCESLILRVGVRFFANIPIKSIEEIGEIEYSEGFRKSYSDWIVRRGFARMCIVVGTPIDRPNIFVKIINRETIDVELLKIKKEGVELVLFYADQPKKIIDFVVNKINLSGDVRTSEDLAGEEL